LRSPLEAAVLGFGASTRNGGIVHPGCKWGPSELIRRYGDETGRALYRETRDGYGTVKRLIADEEIDCDFREVGHLELAYAPSHVRELQRSQAGLALREDPPVLSRLTFPLVPAPYEGRPWFLPLVGEWFRLRDRLAARSPAEP
jgi:glycine/D-amino acid oxidase-like deaminating enzyme